MDHFYFVTCQPGAERLVKAHLATRSAQDKLAFSRPGFMTFKRPGAARLDMPRPTPLARSFGVCFGQARGPDAPAQALARLLDQVSALGYPTRDARLHASTRDAYTATEAPDSAPDPWRADAALRARLEASDGCPPTDGSPSAGQLVLDVIEVDPEVLWLGAHLHGPGHRPSPGGRPPQAVAPPQAPSRVWHKLEEALWWSGLPVQAGDHALDLGCSPGGGTWNLLTRGLHVVGVDPAPVAPQVAQHPRFEHLALAFERLAPERLATSPARWLIFDVNLSPLLTLKTLSKQARAMPRLEGALITLKLNQPELLERLDWMLEQLERADLQILDAAQLFYNRQELCVHARRPR